MITSLNNQQLKHIHLLQNKSKVRKKEKSFVIEGMKMFEESRLEGNLIKSYFSETFYNNKKKEDPDYFSGLSYEIIQDSIFNKVSDTFTPQGVLAIVSQPIYNIKDLLKEAETTLLLLENLQDPGNLGTIVRTAEGAGFTGIILSKDSVDMFNSKVIRSTMGAIYRMPFVYVENFEGTLKEVINNKITIYAAHLEGEHNYDEVAYPKNCGILIGNEGNGLKESTLQYVDTLIKIPMEGKVESLNAAVASAIIMFEVARQRRLQIKKKPTGL